MKILYHLAAAQTHTWPQADIKFKLTLKQDKVQVIETVRLTKTLLDSPSSSEVTQIIVQLQVDLSVVRKKKISAACYLDSMFYSPYSVC